MKRFRSAICMLLASLMVVLSMAPCVQGAPPALELVHRADRLYPMVNACATGTGYDHRAAWMVIGDSTEGIRSIKSTGTESEDVDQPWAYHDGLNAALARMGLIWGGPVSNYCTNTALTRADENFAPNPQSSGFGMSAQTDGSIVANPYGDATSIALTAGRSFPWTGGAVATNAFWNGPLHYIGATPVPGSAASGYFASYTYANPLVRSFKNPLSLGDPTSVGIRLAFSYATNSGGVLTRIQTHGYFAYTDLGTTSLTLNTGGVMTDASVAVAANAMTAMRVSTLHDPVTILGGNLSGGQSNGPIVLSGFQYTHRDIDPTTPTTGPNGYAVTPVYTQVGQTLTQIASEMTYVNVTYTGAFPELIRSVCRSAKYGVFDIHFLGNDIATSANSFKPTDTGVVNARIGAFSNCTWNDGTKVLSNTGIGAGHEVGSIIKVSSGTGWSVGEYKVSSVSANALGLTQTDGTAIVIGSSPTNVGVAAEPHSATGPDQSTPAGIVQNIATISQIITTAWLANGRPLADLTIVFSGAHPQDVAPASTGYAGMFQGVSDWADNSATYSSAGYTYTSRIVVLRTDRMLTPETIRNLGGYNQAAAYTISGITNTNPPTITHSGTSIFSTGDRVSFYGTDETVNTSLSVNLETRFKLSDSSLGTSIARQKEYIVTVTGANTFTVANGGVATAGTKGFIFCQKDISHLRSWMQIDLGQETVNTLFGAAQGASMSSKRPLPLNPRRPKPGRRRREIRPTRARVAIYRR